MKPLFNNDIFHKIASEEASEFSFHRTKRTDRIEKRAEQLRIEFSDKIKKKTNS